MIIELLDGTRFDIANYDLKRLFHHIPSATIEHNSVQVDGRSDIIIKSKMNNRTISVEMVYISNDIFDYYLLRDEINALFMREEPYYITFKNEPHKRWLVKVANQYTIPPNPHMESFTVDFITINNYAESVATTQTLKEWDVDSWGWNGSIDWDEDLQYSFAANDFVVKNLGNVVIDPRKHELEIVLKGSFTNNVKITNRTTGDVYQYNRGLSSTDELRIKGIRTLRNGVSDFKNTNKKLLTLANGINSISVEGGTVQSIAFNFRFLYK